MASDELRRLPTTYYSRDSGVGLALDNCCKGRPRRVADIGLGTGTLAAYGEPGDVFRFYEIDPRVEVIAKNVFHLPAGIAGKDRDRAWRRPAFHGSGAAGEL